ncbi:hypothetical protein OG422_14825 [Streptomyces sp. NBC_01525]|uniref:Uncharacterized protein n=1 Tax=Streptomyces benahoarensis TaxID=2595054 RepID=A0A553Z020_9ACTN|nr:hypothetical protein [Streptomyces benahoarensis]TSB20598.1 hypothetical protein FNJ62_20610 [Streptomyces benahoarensis]TSB34789.1 hypothetical protein FNZ23_21635 [Streptomyces benahoarensis]
MGMFEARSSKDGTWYIVHTPDGHLAHLSGADGRARAAINIATEAEAEAKADALNNEYHRAVQAAETTGDSA